MLYGFPRVSGGQVICMSEEHVLTNLSGATVLYNDKVKPGQLLAHQVLG